VTKKLSREEKAEIRQGLKEIKEGKVIPLSQLETQTAEEKLREEALRIIKEADLEESPTEVWESNLRDKIHELYKKHYDAQLLKLSRHIATRSGQLAKLKNELEQRGLDIPKDKPPVLNSLELEDILGEPRSLIQCEDAAEEQWKRDIDWYEGD